MAEHLPSADPDRTAVREPSAEPGTTDATADATDPRLTGWMDELRGMMADDSPDVPGYRITAEIAKGGMGKVYAAHHLALDREVAIKTLLPGANAERFVTESKITAKLPHPNIPPVHELGTLPDGTPFLAMKLVRGETLSALLKARPSSSADLPRFVQVFEGIAQAVGFAHSRGVIHRDLKPLNVMVGEFGEVQVMDWGLARLLAPLSPGGEGLGVRGMADAIPAGENADLTRAGAVLGTPGYMAPEQARGEPLDARADVFALGAVLASILTGKPAFVGNTVHETIQKAAAADLSDVFTRLDACGADADLIALAKRCLSADRDARPTDGRTVADEVRAYRAGVEARLKEAETDKAKAETRATETRKRQRALTWAGGVIAAVLLAGLGISLWQMFRAMSAESATAEQLKETQKAEAATAAQLVLTEKARKDEATARGRALTALRSMTDVFDKRFAQNVVLTDDDKAFIANLIAQFDAFAAINWTDAENRALRAEARGRAGMLRQTLGEYRAAEADYDAALDLFKQLVADFPTHPEFRQELAKTHNNRGTLLDNTGRLIESEVEHAAALGIYKQLATDFPNRPEFRQGLAGSHNNRAPLLEKTGRLKEAEAEYDTALRLFQQLVAEFPIRLDFRQELATIHNNRVAQLDTIGRLKEAEEQADAALAIRKRLAAEFPTRPDIREELATSHHTRGVLFSATAQTKEAEQEYTAALNIRKQLAADFPTRPEFRENLALSLLSRGRLFKVTGRLKEAESDSDTALGLFKQLVADFPTRHGFRRNLARSHDSRSALHQSRGMLKEAEAERDAALTVRKQLVADFPSVPECRRDLAESHNTRAGLLNETGRLKEAEAEWDAALDIRKQLAADFPSVPEYRDELAGSLNDRAILMYTMGRVKEAEAQWDAALDIRKQLAADFPTRFGFRHELARSHSNRGNLRRVTSRPKEAGADFEAALTLYKQLATEYPTNSDVRDELAGVHNNRGILLMGTGRLKEAQADYEFALAVRKQVVAESPNNPDSFNRLAGACVNLAGLHRQQKNWAEAKQSLLEGGPHHLAALKVNPRHPTYRQFYRNHLYELTLTSAGLLEKDAAVRTAETRRDVGWDAPADARDAAGLLSQCIRIVSQHDKLNDMQRLEATQLYGDAAMRLLHEAVGKGFKDAAKLKSDPTLAPLRQREDFQKLMSELESKGK